MSDELTEERVQSLAGIAGVMILAEDLSGVTARLNYLLNTLSCLEQLPLENIHSVPVLLVPEETR